MTEGNSPRRESDLDDRLRRLREQVREETTATMVRRDRRADGSAAGWALQLSVELAAGLVVGGGIGWVLDHWLGTKPLMLIVFFFLGGRGRHVDGLRIAMEQMNRGARTSDRKQE